MAPAYLGEFEHLLLLAILRLGDDAYGPDIGCELELRAARTVSRGHLYTSLDRLERKGLLRWALKEGTAIRDGLPRRLYAVTPAGLAALRAAHSAIRRMTRGIEPLLKESS